MHTKVFLPQQQGTALSPSQQSSSRSAQQGRAVTDSEPAWAQVTSRALAGSELSHEQDFTPERSREPMQALSVKPLALNTTGHAVVQQGKGSLPPEPCSLHSTSGFLVFS